MSEGLPRFEGIETYDPLSVLSFCQESEGLPRFEGIEILQTSYKNFESERFRFVSIPSNRGNPSDQGKLDVDFIRIWVSIPSNRGNPSDPTGERKGGDNGLSQSPRIGATQILIKSTSNFPWSEGLPRFEGIETNHCLRLFFLQSGLKDCPDSRGLRPLPLTPLTYDNRRLKDCPDSRGLRLSLFVCIQRQLTLSEGLPRFEGIETFPEAAPGPGGFSV